MADGDNGVYSQETLDEWERLGIYTPAAQPSTKSK